MELCFKKHDEIIYDGYTCPICSMIDHYENELSALEQKIEKLEDEINTLNEELAERENDNEK